MFSSAIKSLSSNIISSYSIASQPSSFSGPWKIFDAKKKGSGKAVSVFVFDRKSLEPQAGSFGRQGSSSSLRRIHDEVVERLKKEAGALARLRHPSILELTEPVEETRNAGLMFATEPVTASLGTVLEDKNKEGGRGGRYVSEETEAGGQKRKEFELDELEIQKGLLQVGKGLEFLHESANLVHANLTPEAIFINAKSDWKISGLGFSSPPDNATGRTTMPPMSLGEVLNYDARLPRFIQLNLDYTSPDFVLDTNLTQSADMFSLGLVIVALYNAPHRSPIETGNSVSSYRRVFSTPSSIPTHGNNFHCSGTLPRDIKLDLLPKLITRRPAQRCGAREFQQAQYFDNVLVSTMRFLDSLPAKTLAEKSQFMRGLPRILSQFPKSVVEKKILSALLEETKDLDLLTLVLQNAFKCVELVPNGRRAVSDLIIPKLQAVFLATVKGQQSDRLTLREGGLVVVLDNMSLIVSNCSGKQFKDDVLPIILVGLESPTHSLVDHALQTLPIILPILDFTTVKNDLFPVVANVFAKTTSMAIKIQGLHALNALCGGRNDTEPDLGDGLDGVKAPQKPTTNTALLDKFTIQEKIVPLLRAIKTKEPAVMMAALSVFSQVGKVADIEFLAFEVLPCLWSFSLGPLLNLQQFHKYMQLIKSLSTKIEQEQTRKLMELSSSASMAPASARNFGGLAATNGVYSGQSTSNEETDFESLVTGRNRGSKNDDLFDGGWSTGNVSQIATPQATSLQQPPFDQNQSPSTLSNGFSITGSAGGSTSATSNGLGSFSAMKPSQASNTVASNPWSQPMQPQRTPSSTAQPFNATSLQPSRPQINANGSSNSSIDWSRAGRNNTPATGSTGSSSSNNAYSSFSIAPPPMSPTGTMNVQMPNRSAANPAAQPPKQPPQKQGLDKYESLI
ncbi:MAG: hypothetical protein Q9162_001001 [Coniocarpon cinnabarinum]